MNGQHGQDAPVGRTVPCHGRKGQQEPRQEEAVAEESWSIPVLIPAGFSDEPQGRFRHGESQAFVLHPLPSEDHHDTGADQQKRGEEAQPPEDGGQPDRPGDLLSRLNSFVEPPRRFIVAQVDPVGQVGQDEFIPPVLRRGEVGRRRDGGNHVPGDAKVGHHGRRPAHGEYREEFGAGQRPYRAAGPADQVGKQYEREKRKQKAGGQVGEQHEVVSAAIGHVLRAEPDDARQEEADAGRPERYGLAFPAGREITDFMVQAPYPASPCRCPRRSCPGERILRQTGRVRCACRASGPYSN